LPAVPTVEVAREAWIQQHRSYSNTSGNANDRAYKVITYSRGDTIVTGTTSHLLTGLDMLTLKYSGVDGALVWSRRYNGPASSDDVVQALAADASGNVIVTGQSRGNNYANDYYTAKYAAEDGALLWEQRYNGPANLDDSATDVAVDASGNVIVTGSSHNGTNYDAYTISYASVDGAQRWEKRYNGPDDIHDYAQAVAVDGGGNVVVIGRSYDEQLKAHLGYYTAKYGAEDGLLLWEQH
jgi:hypothetical protein